MEVDKMTSDKMINNIVELLNYFFVTLSPNSDEGINSNIKFNWSDFDYTSAGSVL